MTSRYRKIISKFDGKEYSTANGMITRHLAKYDLTYREYYETYETGVTPVCEFCFKARSFKPNSDDYSQTCGSNVCYGLLMKIKHSSHDAVKKAEIQTARKATTQEKYGVDNVMLIDSVVSKMNATTQVVGKSGLTIKEEQQIKARATSLERYGDEHYNNPDAISAGWSALTVETVNDIVDARRATTKERYGVECIFLLPGNQRKTAKGNSSVKEYTMPGGTKIGIRGVENKALDIIFKTYAASDVYIQDSYDLANALIIPYTDATYHKRKYYPDILIKSLHKIIEVKSQWWYDGNGADKYKGRLENNRRKRQAALDAGYLFEFWIFDSKGKMEIK